MLEICAELSCNHLGSLDRALEIVDAAADAGANLFKLQTWTPGTMCLDKSYTLDSGPWKGRKLVDLYEEAFTPWEWHPIIFARARRHGMIPFSAAFDAKAVDFLETLGVDRHKVASFELTDLPLIRYMASKGKPMILSTGMASESEVLAAYNCTVKEKNWDVTFLSCVSAYPARAEDYQLGRITDGTHTVCKVGLSDHTSGHELAVWASVRGATYIEKHLTLKRSDGGLDSGFSMEPHEFKQMVTECRRAAASIGEVKYGPGPNESTALRRSLWVSKDVKNLDPVVLGHNVVTARPALGESPSLDLQGRIFNQCIKANTPLMGYMLS